MASQYRNIFFYYRGPTHGGSEGAADAKQVEDNTTKALVNTLELGGGELSASFLRAMGIDSPDAAAPFEFYLQRGPQQEAAPARRLLVVTAGENAATSTWSESTATKGRIDAAIHVPGQLLVAIEVKVGAALDWGQLQKHAEDWRLATRPAGDVPAEWIFRTWAEVHRWAQRELEGPYGPATRLLLDQLAEYLEIIGVTPFSGFRVEDFELLEARREIVEAAKAKGLPPDPGDLTQAHLIKDRVAKLWKAILPRLDPAEQMALGRINVGTLRAQDYRIWARTNAGRNDVNFTFELDPFQLELDLVAWRGNQVELVEHWLDDPRSRSDLEALEGFELVVWRRRAIADRRGKPYWMHNTYEELERIPMPPPPDLEERLDGHRAACEAGWELLAFHLRRAWSRDMVLSAGNTLAEEAASALKAAIPLLHKINWQQTLAIRAADLRRITPRYLSDYGVELADDSDRDPTEWQVVVEGPALMVTSPSGMHLRGIRYFIAVWPGPGPDQAAFVAFTLTKGYASGGREGHVTLLHYGPDLREAIRRANADRLEWEQSEHFPSEFQPANQRPLDAAEVLRVLRRNQRVSGPDWSELDAIAARAYEGLPPAGSWADADEACVMSYMRMLN